MDFKLSISILISSAYFLTLLIINVIKSGNILQTLFSSIAYSSILFLVLYMLLLYIGYAFENLRKKESQDALEHIKRIENEFKQKQKKDLDNRLKELRKQEDEERSYSTPFIKPSKEEDEEENDIKKLKRDSGTQFDSTFLQQGGPNI